MFHHLHAALLLRVVGPPGDQVAGEVGDRPIGSKYWPPFRKCPAICCQLPYPPEHLLNEPASRPAMSLAHQAAIVMPRGRRILTNSSSAFCPASGASVGLVFVCVVAISKWVAKQRPPRPTVLNFEQGESRTQELENRGPSAGDGTGAADATLATSGTTLQALIP
ncbi:hypothetical protein AK812_SmicGene39236 [Symbiodinium microadriaticum]|uniref:Uncharacterized protein n=1 Tax=Symbiodinium microadriaticum TaxID=2951 RepID=A0A1Q9CBN7_SYMMI|nr:hypothetical protein AK812_SmicGene39236 [Symbiodinium microadriaticum]